MFDFYSASGTRPRRGDKRRFRFRLPQPIVYGVALPKPIYLAQILMESTFDYLQQLRRPPPTTLRQR